MTLLEIIFIGAGLSMDAFAVCISACMTYRGLTFFKRMSMPLAFCLFQGLMPILGYSLGALFSDIITRYSGIVAFAVLMYIGVSMIKDSLSSDDSAGFAEFSFKLLIVQSIATSIDAFAVGVSLAASSAPIFSSACIIALTTLILCTLAVFIGTRVGERLGDRAQISGGAVLIIIGIKSLIGI